MKSFIYSLKVWVTSLLLGPMVYYPVQMVMENQYSHPFSYSLIYMFLFSLPSFILSIVIVSLVRTMTVSQLVKKLILSIAGVLLTAMPLYLLDSKFSQQFKDYTIAYGSIIVIGIWIYRLDEAANM